jgi:LCP family protein required for cell wall assembly
VSSLMVDQPPESTPAQREGRPRAATIALVTAGILSLLIAAGSSLSIATIRRVERRIPKIAVGVDCRGSGCLRHVTPECVDQACNFLILGSDSREGLSKRQLRSISGPDTKGQRADTILLVHVDRENDRTVVLSIPRDLQVTIPGHGVNKINTAFQHGPDVMVQAVQRLTGLRINHYVEVNFVGFQHLVDALGGVPVCINRPMVDTLAGLNLPRAGCYRLRGERALAFVRARHIEGDLIPDFSRIARQQQFMRALIQKVLSVSAVTQLPRFITAAQQNLVIDENLNLYALQDLTIELARLGQKSVLFRVVPAVPVEVEGVDYVRLLEPDASRLFGRIGRGRPLGRYGQQATLTPITPANVTVRLLDANSGGRAARVAAYLERAGFLVPSIEPAPSELTMSVILWARGSAKMKELVASYLTNLPVEFDSEHTRRAQVTVVIGPDYQGIEGL